MSREKTLNDYIPSMKTGAGLFSAMTGYRWWSELNASKFDIYFALKFGNHVGFSDLLDAFTNDDGIITGSKLEELAYMILSVNQNNWAHVYKALMSEYNPIENTDFVEEHEGEGHAEGANTTTTTGSIENADEVRGFNSSTDVPTGKGTTTYNDHEVGNETNADSTNKLKITKHGNIGTVDVSTMLRKDVTFWASAEINKIADIMCMDICNIIALSIY
jgi:hypothetical protein